MKLYVVIYDNGEPYDDAFDCVDQIFLSLDAAKKYLTDMGLEEDTSCPVFNVDSVKNGRRIGYHWKPIKEDASLSEEFIKRIMEEEGCDREEAIQYAKEDVAIYPYQFYYIEEWTPFEHLSDAHNENTQDS